MKLRLLKADIFNTGIDSFGLDAKIQYNSTQPVPADLLAAISNQVHGEGNELSHVSVTHKHEYEPKRAAIIEFKASFREAADAARVVSWLASDPWTPIRDSRQAEFDEAAS
jgi:hypothetical protein